MKQVQRDSKYIIKRILIGVGIALILANLRKCNVYADSIPTYCISSNFRDITTSNCDTTNYINNGDYNISYNNYFNSSLNYYIQSFYNESLELSLFYFNQLPEISYLNNYKYLGFKNMTNADSFDGKTFYMGSYSLINYNQVSWDFDDPNRTYDIARSDNSYVLISPNETVINNYYNYYSYYSSKSSFVSNGITYYYIVNYGYFFDNYNYFSNATYNNYLTSIIPNESVQPNFDNVYIINENNQVSDSSLNTLPSYFLPINFENNQAVFFVPKNYSNVPTYTLDNNLFISFDMYYSGLIRESYFNINNNQQWTFPNNEDLYSATLDEYITSFPMFFDNNINNNNYTALMFNKVDDSNEVIIYYDSRYFNYYLIEDLSTAVFTDISYIDRNGNEVVSSLSFATILEDYWLDGFNVGGNDFNTSQSGIEKLKNYIELLKLPFHIYYKILEQTYTGVCEPLMVPVPRLGGYIQLDCLSTIFNNVLTPGFYTFIKKCLNMVYLIIFTIWNVRYVMDAISPNLYPHTDTGGMI